MICIDFIRNRRIYIVCTDFDCTLKDFIADSNRGFFQGFCVSDFSAREFNLLRYCSYNFFCKLLETDDAEMITKSEGAEEKRTGDQLYC